MLSEVRKLIPTDVFIGSAAVSDFKPSKKVKGKIKKEDTQKMTIELTRTPDILESAREHTKILVGFSLESDDIEKNTVYKMKRKRMDMIVGNTPESFSKSSGNYFIGYNTPEGIRIDKLGNIHKRKLAQKIIDKVIEIWNYL